MSEYLHGAYGKIKAVGTKAAATGASAIVYVGTAPVHLVAGGAANVNKPIVVENIAQARAALGYSDDWAKYTLCEAMSVHLEQNGVGPIVLINVLDPTNSAHKDSAQTSVTATPANGRVVIANAENVYMDSVTVTGKTAGTDYTIAYDYAKKTMTLKEISAGGLGNASLTIKYDTMDATKVTASNVVGSAEAGVNTGLYAVKNVYQVTGYVPSFLAAPGWSSDKTVHDAMATVSAKVNGHFDLYMFVDLPITANSSTLTMANAATWKTTNGYNHDNETVYYPMANGTDGKKYHLSVLAAANLQSLLIDQDGIPYRSASNTACPIIKGLYIGSGTENNVYDDTLINDLLNKHGIASAAFVGGRWAIWGAHSASYDESTNDLISVSETNRMMLYYISNDFQVRRWPNVDKPMTANDIASIVSEEQSRLDALVKIGALTYGTVSQNADATAKSDIMNGDFSFVFNVTTTPLAKSLTAVVQWTDEGFSTYYA